MVEKAGTTNEFDGGCKRERAARPESSSKRRLVDFVGQGIEDQ